MADKKLLHPAAMEKILKNAGASRVSDDAKDALKSALEEIAAEISARAIKFSEHAGRKTVKASDIQLALKQRQ